MIHEVVGTLFYVALVATSSWFYSHRGRWYAKGKTKAIPSAQTFRAVYLYLRLSTFAIGVACLYSSHPILLKLHESLAIRYAGMFVSALAMFLFVTAKIQLGKEYSPCFDSFVPTHLVRTGVYRYLRHPIYVSNVALLLALTVASGSAWMGMNAVILGIYYLRAARVEESVLAQEFPEYSTYRARTAGLAALRRASRGT